jgi:predicted kinase
VNQPPRIFLVTGIPGAGKTTVARLLAQRFERGVHVEADALHRFIVTGALWPNQEPRDEAVRQLALRATNAAVVAANFFDHGFTVVVDDVIIGCERLGIYERELGARPFSSSCSLPRSTSRSRGTRREATRRPAASGRTSTPSSATTSGTPACGSTPGA